MHFAEALAHENIFTIAKKERSYRQNHLGAPLRQFIYAFVATKLAFVTQRRVLMTVFFSSSSASSLEIEKWEREREKYWRLPTTFLFFFCHPDLFPASVLLPTSKPLVAFLRKAAGPIWPYQGHGRINWQTNKQTHTYTHIRALTHAHRGKQIQQNLEIKNTTEKENMVEKQKNSLHWCESNKN